MNAARTDVGTEEEEEALVECLQFIRSRKRETILSGKRWQNLAAEQPTL